MKTIRLYRHPNCERCARVARTHHRMDWLDHYEDTTTTPPSGKLRVGEIAVEDLRSGAVLTGIDSFRLLCKQIPAYWPLIPLTYFPPVRHRIQKELSGCSDGACEVS